ncbi:hypothetical protein SYNTR_1574 [Candidatus Syntrophocurvum alkaliphilum]|uniref:Oxidoreductase, short-chain dehydrogenase/reductase family n=1 Tax=Candidatus Syntrophocurvum alkaliphilum TaxID=2293317 RepID=A0A6I6DGR4_9FIRM|nr:SDR family NAD(P)-dependent oxidoreductase [Candidatus Syntrophocurvum alkaliphilum]QGU00168.1 hypothetical protein SYNTR_1574 [Candidatus Syntrophocurvum alkaliphilum]
MGKYTGKVIAITGAANGIGRELAIQYAKKGAKLSLSDIDAKNLESLVAELKGTEIVTAVFDVGNYEDMEAYAKKTYDTFGTVDIFYNNAGVAVVGNIWEQSLKDWKWAFDTNVMGVVHGIKSFVPRMIEQDKECRIINTASVAGLLVSPNSPVYVSSKHAAVTLTEVLNLQLQLAGAKVRASALCPGFVVSDLHNSDRHRPQELQNDPNKDPYYQSEDYKTKAQIMEQSVTGGMATDKAVEIIIKAVEDDEFFIMTHPEYKPIIEMRMKNILEQNRPSAI